MIRFILVLLFLGIFFIFSIPIYLVELIIGKFSPKKMELSSLRMIQFALRMVGFISGTKTKVIGYENIPKDQAVLFVGNHRSFFDVVISYPLMPGATGFVAKKELKKVPFLSTWMWFANCLFLDRKDIKEGLKTILKGIELVKNGTSIVIFPEGTRNTGGDVMMPFHEGSLKIAEKSGCLIVPMVQNNTSMCFEDHFPKVKKNHTVIEFGEPIDVSTLSKEQRKFLGAYVRDIMIEMYERNQKYCENN